MFRKIAVSVSLLVFIAMSSPALASEEELREAYEASIIESGLLSRATGLRALELGRFLSRQAKWSEALSVFKLSLATVRNDPGSTQQELYQSLFELGRAHRRSVRIPAPEGSEFESGQAYLDEALEIAISEFGADSEEVGRTYFELGRPILRHNYSRGGIGTRFDHRYGGIFGGRYRAQRLDTESLDRAEEILSNFPGNRTRIALIQVMRAFGPLGANDQYQAARLLDPALDYLTRVGYADELSITAYQNLLSYRIPRMTRTRGERTAQEFMDYAALRQNGDVIPLHRPVPQYPMHLVLNGTGGQVCVTYSIESDGTTSNVQIYASSPPDLFDEASIAAASNFVYLPRIEDGVAVPIEEVRFCFEYVAPQGGARNVPSSLPVSPRVLPRLPN